MIAAKKLVADYVAKQRFFARGRRIANHDRLTLEYNFVVDESRIVRGARTAPTASLDLHLRALVGNLKHAASAVKEKSAEVSDQAE